MGTEARIEPLDGVAEATTTGNADGAKRTDADAEIERLIETDPALVPTGASQFVVAARLLEDEELAALLQGLAPLLDGDDPFTVEQTGTDSSNSEAESALSEEDHEPHTAPTGCTRRHPQLSPLAWLFPNHAGAGRPARHQQ